MCIFQAMRELDPATKESLAKFLEDMVDRANKSVEHFQTICKPQGKHNWQEWRKRGDEQFYRCTDCELTTSHRELWDSRLD